MFQPNPMPQNFPRTLHATLKSWQQTKPSPESDQFAELRLVQAQLTQRFPTLVEKKNALTAVLQDGINAVEQLNSEYAYILRQRFEVGKMLKTLKDELHLSLDRMNHKQREAIGYLANVLWEMECRAISDVVDRLLVKLPPTTHQTLYGFADMIDSLTKRLLQKSCWILAIVGIGGIGKTAAADAMARQLIYTGRFEELIWLRYENQIGHHDNQNPKSWLIFQLAQALGGVAANCVDDETRLFYIRKQIKEFPHLIIIDNLEEKEQGSGLLDLLNDLCNPTKFILTSRAQIPTSLIAYSHKLGELQEKFVAELLLGEADISGLFQGDDQLTRDDVLRIYRVVGGNPLALKLVLGLLQLISLDQVLTNLQYSPKDEIEKMYHRIYWQHWQSLNNSAKSLLLAMPLVAQSGGTIEVIQQIAEVPTDQFLVCLNELFRLSLLEVRGTVREKRYGIHRLTESFLKTDILGYSADHFEIK